MPQKLQQCEVQVILASPEMLGNPRFFDLMTSSKYTQKIGVVVIDEAHCISQWGGDFRPTYRELGKLRAMMPLGIPILATSATLTPLALTDTRKVLEIQEAKSFHLNLGNDRENVKLDMRLMKSEDDYGALDFVVRDAQLPEDLPRAIIFVNHVSTAHAVAQRLRKASSFDSTAYIDILHSRRAPDAKAKAWEKFASGQVRILVATEAAAMVRTKVARPFTKY